MKLNRFGMRTKKSEKCWGQKLQKKQTTRSLSKKLQEGDASFGMSTTTAVPCLRGKNS